MTRTDSYQVLELSEGASPNQVKAAYRQMVRQWHPDKFPDDPEKQGIAQQKIREIIGAYHLLSRESVTAQRDPAADLRDAVEACRSSHAPREPGADDEFYKTFEEAVRNNSNTSGRRSRNSQSDGPSTRQKASTQSSVAGRQSCAYVGGDPRLKHISPGFLGCPAAVAWNSSGMILNTTGDGSAEYPAGCIRSVHLSRRNPLAFLAENTVRLAVTDAEESRKESFVVKLRFKDRTTAEQFVRQLRTTLAVKSRSDDGRPVTATLAVLLFIVASGLGIGFTLWRNGMNSPSNAPPDRPVVSDQHPPQNGNGIQTEKHSAVESVTEVGVRSETEIAVEREAVLEIERNGGSVISRDGRVVQVRLAGARINARQMAQISALRDVEELTLHATTITGPEFRFLVDLPNLRELDIGGTQNAAAGVQHLAALTNLQILRLSNTNVGDGELKLLEQLPDLQELELIQTQVTEIGISNFNAARPQCLVID